MEEGTQQPTTLLNWVVRIDWLVCWLVWVFLLWIQLVGGRNPSVLSGYLVLGQTSGDQHI